MNNNALPSSPAQDMRRIVLGIMYTLCGLTLLSGCATTDKNDVDAALKPEAQTNATEKKAEEPAKEKAAEPEKKKEPSKYDEEKPGPPYSNDELRERPPWPPDAVERDEDTPNGSVFFAYDYKKGEFIRDEKGGLMVEGLIYPKNYSRALKEKSNQYAIFTQRLTLEAFFRGEWVIAKYGKLAAMKDVRKAIELRDEHNFKVFLAAHSEPEVTPPVAETEKTSVTPDADEEKPIVVGFCEAKKNVDKIVASYMAIRPDETMYVDVKISKICLERPIFKNVKAEPLQH